MLKTTQYEKGKEKGENFVFPKTESAVLKHTNPICFEKILITTAFIDFIKKINIQSWIKNSIVENRERLLVKGYVL